MATPTEAPLVEACLQTYNMRDAAINAAIRGPSTRSNAQQVQAGLAGEEISGRLPDPTISFGVAPLSVASDNISFGLTAQISQGLPWASVRAHQREEAAAQTATLRATAGDNTAAAALLAANLFDLIYLAEQGLRSVAEEREHLTQLHSSALAMVSAGVNSTSDALQVENAMATLQVQELSWQTQIDTTRLQLEALIGDEADLSNISSETCLPRHTESPNQRVHPSIASARAQVEAASHRVALADLSSIPTPVLMGGLTNMKMNWEHAFTVGIGLSIPLPAAVSARRDRASSTHSAATFALQWQTDRVAGEVESTRIEFERALEEIAIIEDSLIPTATRLAQVTSERVAMGRAPMAEAIQAEQGLTTARMQLNRSVAKAWMAYSKLQRATGHFGYTYSESEQ